MEQGSGGPTGARNVTPGSEQQDTRGRRGWRFDSRADSPFDTGAGDGDRWGGMNGRDQWRQDWGWAGGRPGFPWLGVLLVLIGIGLAVRTIDERIGIGDLLVLAVGLAFVARWLVGRSRGAMVPGLVLVAFGLSGILRDLGVLVGEGWTPLFLGVALLIVWLLGRIEGGRHGWALWLGGLLLLYGLTRVSDQLLGLPDLGIIWPVLIVLAGVVLIAQGSRMGAGRR